MAAGLGFKDFTTGEVLTAADVDGYLMQGIWVFANAAARTAAVTSPQEGNYSFLKDTNSTEYYTGSAWVAIGGGGGGKVLQVVNATYSTETTNSTSTFADTGLTASITPSSATSTILVTVVQAGIGKSAANNDGSWKLLRGATTLATFETAAPYTNAATVSNIGASGITYLDSPATTSSTTYKTQFKNNVGGTGTITAQYGGSTASITLMEIGA